MNMKQRGTAVFLPILFALLTLGVLLRSQTASGQPATLLNNFACTGENLLLNPSFEGQYTAYQLPPPGHPDCQTLDPAAPNQHCGRVQIAPGWSAFWRDAPRDNLTMNIQPEYTPSATWEMPPRVRSGEASQHYFSFYSTHEAGLYQQVTAVPGGHYCFNVWGHAWSANTTNPDYTSSEDHGNLFQKIGIDPTGGVDWQSPDVIWSDGRLQYDTFGLFSLEATALSETITIFLHSRPEWPVKHNDVYWDDAFLSLTNQMVVTAPPIFLLTAVDAPITQTHNLAIDLPDGFAWTAVLDPAGTITPSLAPLSGTTSAVVTVELSSSGLMTGTYSNTITIAAPGTVGGPVQTPIQVLVALEVWQTYLPMVRKP